MKPRISILGVGHMGSYHASVMSQNFPDFFRGVYDLDPEKSKLISNNFGVKSFSSIDQMLEDSDAIIIASPTPTHYSYTKKALESDKHVLIEKPLADNLEHAKEICEIAKNRRRNLLVGHVERYNAAVQELSHLIKSPRLWISRRIGPSNDRIKGVGVSLDLLVHDLDICIRMMKSDVKKVQASGFSVDKEYEDGVSVNIEFENGCLANFLACRVSHQKERLLTIIDKDYNIILDFTNQDITVYRKGASSVTTEPNQIRYKLQSTMERLFIHKENPLKLEIEDFVNSITGNTCLDTSIDLKTLELALHVKGLLSF